MSFILFNQIAESFYATLGGKLMNPLVIIALLAALLFAAKGGKIVFVIILVPLVSAFFVGGTSKFFEGSGFFARERNVRFVRFCKPST